MRFFRRRLSTLLSLWLVCQVIALAAPVVLAATGSTVVEELCTCPGGDHETCPMHHGRQAEAPGPAICGMSSCFAPVDVALLSMAGGAGILADPPAAPLLTATPVIALPDPVSFDIAITRDTPPPRL
jgi:hypothetical protein